MLKKTFLFLSLILFLSVNKLYGQSERYSELISKAHAFYESSKYDEAGAIY